jgi:hypothetical protein
MGSVCSRGSQHVDVSSLLKKRAGPCVATLLLNLPFTLFKCSDEGLAFQEAQGLNYFDDPKLTEESRLSNDKVDPLHTLDQSGIPHLSLSQGPFLPRWQTSPVLETSLVNENLFEKPHVADIARECIATKSAVLGGFVTAPAGGVSHPNPDTAFFATLRSIWEGEQVNYLGDPMSHLVLPIFDTLDGVDRKVVAVLKSTIHWRWYLRDILPNTNQGITVVLENACQGNFTYHLVGTEARVVGFGDQHDPEYSEYHFGGSFETETIEDGTSHGIPLNQEGCPYSFHIFATPEDEDSHVSNDPIIISVSVAAVFFFTIALFFFYDRLVERRQRVVLAKATQSTAIVASLFVSSISWSTNYRGVFVLKCPLSLCNHHYSQNKSANASWRWRATRGKEML